MHRKYINSNASGLWGKFLLRREMAIRDRLYRDNVNDFINLLSYYIPQNSVEHISASGGLYEHLCKKHGEKPCGGYAVSIAIEKLPGNFKNSSKKSKTVDYVIRKQRKQQ